MSGELVSTQAGDLTQFKPKGAKVNDAKADAVIDFAKRSRDWPTLEAAVEKKMEDQTEFVRWWDETVRPDKGGDRRSENQKRSTGFLVANAEELAGVTQQQVSKWRRRLKEPEKYRAMLFGAAYAKATLWAEWRARHQLSAIPVPAVAA